MSDVDAALLLHEYELSIDRSEAATRATLKRMLEDVRASLDRHGRIAIFIEKAV
jgi:hypothetical protein